VLQSSFQHIPGISQRRERDLWQTGITSWDEFALKLNGQLPLFAGLTRDRREKVLQSSREALENSDAEYFAMRLPRREHYRIALAFPSQTLFLDIETTGLSRYYDEITLVGWSFGSHYGVYVKGDSPKSLLRAVSQAKAVVTFNGSLFDIPFIRHEFPTLSLPLAHVDLRFLSRRVGLSGGQKAIERELGIDRSEELRDLDGKEAPLLWQKYRRGDREALRLLIKYNHADIDGMKDIFDTVITRLFQTEHLPKASFPIHQFSTAKSRVPVKVRHKISARPKITLADVIAESAIAAVRIVGIDLTGSESRPSGWCLLNSNRAWTQCLSSDDELVEATLACKPTLVSIDSPLALPRGRTTVSDDDPGRKQYGIMRSCEKILKRRGISVYPCLIPSMQALTARGIRLAEKFRQVGIPVIESYPGAAQDIMGIPRKRASLDFLRLGLSEFGVRGKWTKEAKTHDELDALTSALVGLFYWSGRFERLGDEDEGYLIVPDLKVDPSNWLSRTVIGTSGAIAAGKTTSAEFLRDRGYFYDRFSLVLSDILAKQGVKVTRKSLQRKGNEVYQKAGQRWLCSLLVSRLPESGDIVIDGLRHPEDHAHLLEEYGPGFNHIHVEAPYNLRAERYLRLGHTEAEFDRAMNHPVERNVEMLKALAHKKITNASSIGRLRSRIQRLARSK